MAAVPNRASFRWLTIPLLVAAGVYAWYAISQYYRLNELNQRQLSNAGAELKTALDNAAETVKKFNEKWTAFDETSKRAVGPPDPGERPGVCDFVRSQPYLELEHCASGDTTDEIPWGKYMDAQWRIDSALEIEVSGDASSMRFRYRIERMLQELAFSDAFALIFVATDKGRVLYEDAPTRRQWLRHLRWGERTFRDAYADRPPTLQIHDIQQIVGGEAAWNTLRSVTSRTNVALGGTDYLLYLQPLALDDERSLIVGGAVPRSAVFRDALALGTSLLGVLVFFVLAGVLGFPFVKLTCLDMCERFSLWDIRRLYVSSGALLVLFTCAALALDGYVRWRLEANRGLEALATHLEGRFLNEVSAIRDQLARYDQLVATRVENGRVPPCNQWAVDTHWYDSPVQGQLPWAPDAHLRTVAWIEPGGRQIWKSTADAVPGKLRVGHRVYFRAVRDGNLFEIDGNGPPIFIAPDRSIADGKFYTFVSMRSRIPPSLCADQMYRGEPVGTPVVSTTVQLMSLDRQPLPAGYGFALINREGRVLYHSDGRLSLRENLYDELSEGARARALTYAGTSDSFDTRYRERPYRFYLHPVGLSRATPDNYNVRSLDEHGKADAGFYLAVFRDTSVEQALVGHVFVAGLVGPMVLFLFLSATALGVLTLAGRRHGHCWSVWLWPHGGLNHIYQRQAVAFVALLIVSAGLSVTSGSVTPFLVLPFLSAAVAVGIYWHGAPETLTERSRLSMPFWQTLSVFLALVCMVVVPTAALFRVTLNEEFADLILTDREWIKTQSEDWVRAETVAALDQGYAPSRTMELLAARARYVACVPAPFDAPMPVYTADVPVAPRTDVQPATLQAAPEKPAISPTNCTTQSPSGEPLRTSPTLQPIGMVSGVVDQLKQFDNFLPIENEIVSRQLFHKHGQSYSPGGTLFRWFRASGTSLLGFSVVFVLLGWWIRWNTNHVFFADMDAPGTPPSDTFEQIFKDCTEDEQMVLVQIARERIANPYQRPVIEKLVEKGLVRLAPYVRPFSEPFEQFLRAKERELGAQIKKWQEVNALHSWRYGRLMLAGTLVAEGLFLIATQPGLQSSVMAIAGGVTGVLTAGAKLQEAIASWFARKHTA